jgi:hypothetical protein
MKNLILILCVVVTFFSCKNKSEIDELGKNESSNYPPHCFNNIKDADETGIDCGGKCETCTPGIPSTPSCTVSTNSIVINNVTSSINLGTADSGSFYTVTGLYGNSKFYRLMLKSIPDQTKVYTIDGTTPDQDNDVFFQISYNLSTLFLTSGKVYFKNNGNSYTAVICNGSGEMTGLTIPVTANLTFQ